MLPPLAVVAVLHSTHAHSAWAVAAEVSRESATSRLAICGSRVIGIDLRPENRTTDDLRSLST